MQSGQPQSGSDEGREPHRAVLRAEVFDMVGNPLPTSFAAGADLKTIADQLGHSSVVLTADTYLSVAVELGLTAAVEAARLVLRAGRYPPGTNYVRSHGEHELAAAAA
jgi:hypothetical protein